MRKLLYFILLHMIIYLFLPYEENVAARRMTCDAIR